jgi:hypothetical protein
VTASQRRPHFRAQLLQAGAAAQLGNVRGRRYPPHMDDGLIAGLPSCCGRYLVIVEAVVLDGAGRLDAAEFTSALDAVAVKLDVTRVPLVFMQRVARIGVLVEADGPVAGLIAGTDAVAAAGDGLIEVKRSEIRAVPVRTAVLAASSDLAALALVATG